MTLTLLAVSLNERPLSQPITAHFDNRGGTIGRADHNTMALPDPERHVSRLQAEIIASGTGFLIRNVGAANPIVVAGRSIARGESASLAHGDEVRIGGYLLQVDCSKQEAALDITRGRALLSAGVTPLPPALRTAPRLPAAPAAPAESVAPAASGFSVAQVPAARAPVSPPVPASENPFADLLGPGPLGAPGSAGQAASSSDPFADLLGNSSSSPSPSPSAAMADAFARPKSNPQHDPFADLMPAPAGLHSGSAGLSAAPTPAPQRLPDNFDPFASFAAPASPSLQSGAPADASDPFADLMPASPPASIDILFGLGSDAAADPLANFMAHTPPASAAGGPVAGGGGGVSTDPLQALFGDAGPAPAAAPAQADHFSALNAAYQAPRVLPAAATPPPAAAAPAPPAVVPPAPPPLSRPAPPAAPFAAVLAMAAQAPSQTPPPAPARPAAPSASHSADAQQLWAALCEGAGIDLPLPAGMGEERMREVGRILRSAVDGALRLMAVRASTKHELRAAVTIIQAKGNNPLKFSPDAKSGLEYLLAPSVRGFLEGPAAMDDAMHDLVGHSIGTVAGMRAAIDGMLDRFAPAELETKLVGKSVLDSVLPINRKAKLWDLYLQHHDAIREEAQEDFHTLFGKAFLAAYDQQIAQLQRKPR